MVFHSWNDVIKCLEAATGKATQKQSALATYAGIRIPRGTPQIVAAALLRAGLSKELNLPILPPPIHEWLKENLATLRQHASRKPDPSTNDEAKAWIDYLRLADRRKCLRTLKIAAGDTVTFSNGRLGIVSSIGEDGRVYFEGGKGYCTWPDLIESIARRNDHSPTAMDLKLKAANFTSSRKMRDEWTTAKRSALADHAVVPTLTLHEIDLLQETIEQAADERLIQVFLQTHMNLLAALLTGVERFCIPQKRLGAEFVPDFLLADVDSRGVRWILLELETPRSRIYLSDLKSLSKPARCGVDQILDWRNWLSDNTAYARRRRNESGLGLIDIKDSSEAIVLVGRRSSLPGNTVDAKRNEMAKSGIQIHTYDWLVERLRGTAEYSGIPDLNPNAFRRSREAATTKAAP